MIPLHAHERALCSLWGISGASPGLLWELLCTPFGASCAEPSEARLRAADQEMICFIIVLASEASEGQGELQHASLLSRGVKRCVV